MKPQGLALLVGGLLGLVACGGMATQDHRSTGGTSSTGTGGVGAAPIPGGAGGDGGTERGGSSGGAGAQGGAELGGADPDGGAGGDPDQGGAAPTGGGGASSGGVVEGGGSSGSGAAAGNGGDGGAVSSGYCPGFEPDPLTIARTRCATHADCLIVAVVTQCATEPFTFGCGGPAPVRSCVVDEDCAAEAICEEDACGSTWCVRGCPDLPCSGTETCIEKRCVDRPCDAEGAATCADRHACRPEDPGADARGCVPEACAAGATCPEGWDCAPGTAADVHGCVHRTCSTAVDCDCGSCVNGFCEASPGFCFEYRPPV